MLMKLRKKLKGREAERFSLSMQLVRFTNLSMQFKTQEVLPRTTMCEKKLSLIPLNSTDTAHNSKKWKTSLRESICKESWLRITHGQQWNSTKAPHARGLVGGKCLEYSFV